LIDFLRRLLSRPRWHGLKSSILLIRGILHAGHRYQCPCCGWRIRRFLAKNAIFAGSPTGYCPRCNAKARHRRHCLYVDQHRPWEKSGPRVLEVAPWWAVSRHLRKRSSIEFVGVDVRNAGPHVTVVGDVTSLPFSAGAFDVVLCTHVLEHVPMDHTAIAELYRVLDSEGTAIVSVPIRMDHPTVEDPTVTDPDERHRLFGERSHVRWYGRDFVDRLRVAGFAVSMDAAADVPRETRALHGLRDDENLFLCRKPDVPADVDSMESTSVETLS